MKGRPVRLGDNVKDQDFNWAEFCELGSSPPSMEAARALDALGSLPGYTVKGDARGAHRHSLMHGAETWVTLPESRWPTCCINKYKNPVVLVVLHIYGHADAGGYCEDHSGRQHPEVVFLQS